MDATHFQVGQNWNTRDGRVATILTIGDPGEHSYPISAVVDGVNRSYALSGQYYMACENPLDLISLVEQTTAETAPAAIEEIHGEKIHGEEIKFASVGLASVWDKESFADRLIMAMLPMMNQGAFLSADQIMVAVQTILTSRATLSDAK